MKIVIILCIIVLLLLNRIFSFEVYSGIITAYILLDIALLWDIKFLKPREEKLKWQDFFIISILAIYQPLHFCAYNFFEIDFLSGFFTILFVYIQFFLIYCLLNLFFKDKIKSLFSAIIFSFLFLHFYENVVLYNTICSVLLWIVCKIQLSKIKKNIIVLVCTLLLLITLEFTGKSIQIINNKISAESNIISDLKTSFTGEVKKRDIYIILLDMYSGADVLKQEYGFDNSTFINELKQEGFFVFDKMYSNYDSTYISLPSMLNLKYFEQLNKEPSSYLIENAELYKIAKTQGYKTVFMRNEAIKPKQSKYLDIVVEYGKVNRLYETFRMLFEKSIYNSLINSTNLIDFLSNVYEDNVDQAIDIKNKKFSFWHMYMPHPPFLYDENKNKLNSVNFKTGYVPYLKYTNKWTLDAIRKIKNNKKDLPVIIITGDHGIKQSNIDSYFSVFTAYYNPEQEYSHVKNSKTLINFFINFSNYELKTTFPNKEDKIICTISKCGAKYPEVARTEHEILKFFNTSKNITNQLLK